MKDILLAIFLGGFFGFALYSVGAAKRSNIRAMLRLERLELMKIILFAIGLASTLLAVAALVGIFNVGHLSVKEMNAGVVLGGVIFGIGFGTLGACPGTSLASLPYGNKLKTAAIVLGGLFGAWAFSLTYGWWKTTGLFATWNLGKLTLFQLSDKYPSLFSCGYGGLLLFGCLLMFLAWLLPQEVLTKNNK